MARKIQCPHCQGSMSVAAIDDDGKLRLVVDPADPPAKPARAEDDLIREILGEGDDDGDEKETAE